MYGTHAPDLAEQEAELRSAMEAMGPPRVFELGPDGSGLNETETETGRGRVLEP